MVMEVTEEVVERATPRNSGHCVIADALALAVPEAAKISVDLQTIRYSLPSTGKRYVYLTPAPAQRALVDFDQGVRPEVQSIRLGRPIQIVPINRSKKVDRGDTDTVKRKRNVITVIPDGREGVAVRIGGDTPPTAALSSPPVMNSRRYSGQRRSFGLKILRP